MESNHSMITRSKAKKEPDSLDIQLNKDENYDDEPSSKPITSIDTKSVTGIGGVVILLINFKEIIVQILQKFLLGG